jgi:hypothetical protein
MRMVRTHHTVFSRQHNYAMEERLVPQEWGFRRIDRAFVRETLTLKG